MGLVHAMRSNGPLPQVHILGVSNKLLCDLTLTSIISNNQKYNNNPFVFHSGIQILSEGKMLLCPRLPIWGMGIFGTMSKSAGITGYRC